MLCVFCFNKLARIGKNLGVRTLLSLIMLLYSCYLTETNQIVSCQFVVSIEDTINSIDYLINGTDLFNLI